MSIFPDIIRTFSISCVGVTNCGYPGLASKQLYAPFPATCLLSISDTWAFDRASNWTFVAGISSSFANGELNTTSTEHGPGSSKSTCMAFDDEQQQMVLAFGFGNGFYLPTAAQGALDQVWIWFSKCVRCEQRPSRTRSLPMCL